MGDLMNMNGETCELKLSETLAAGAMIPETAVALKEPETGWGTAGVSLKS